ncbi:MAG: NAD+ synthase [Dehalococcoidia bacterium]|nr:MAG: NAD+ synthase [Dehalococcoidia bacterium]
MRKLRIGLAQINATVGDFAGNTKKIQKTIKEGKSLGIDILTFPELAICGYPPEDLLFKTNFISENQRSVRKIVDSSSGIDIIVGFVDSSKDIYNAAAVIHDGKLVGVYRKIYLPNYGIFDEKRYFRTGSECPIYIIGGVGVGINICEDIWYEDGPTRKQIDSGAEIIINISASPYHFGKGKIREKMLSNRAVNNTSIIAFNNLVGGQDELVFDGNSLIVDHQGQLLTRGRQFEEDLLVADLDVAAVRRARLDHCRWEKWLPSSKDKQCPNTKVVISKLPLGSIKPLLPRRELKLRKLNAEIYDALVLGTHDYIVKNGFSKVVIGLSGGIDSSLVSTVAVDALGNKNVIGVSMPLRYSSAGGISDARSLARNLGIRLITISIEKAFQAYLEMLADTFRETKPDVTEENIQARIRGNILMALSNKFGWLVLTTGNKSEMATGYTTLYGDMAGGFAVIKDVPKTMVYQLVKYRNTVASKQIVPISVIKRAPSAELRPEQQDINSLPAYDLLDPILTAYVEEDRSLEQIIASGIDEDVARQVIRLVDASEYKRRQSPPGLKITPKAFGRDRRMPITNRFKG